MVSRIVAQLDASCSSLCWFTEVIQFWDYLTLYQQSRIGAHVATNPQHVHRGQILKTTEVCCSKTVDEYCMTWFVGELKRLPNVLNYLSLQH